jgi:hypothetical protein
MRNRTIGSFFFAEARITGNVYLDMLEEFIYCRIADFHPIVF